MPHAAQTASLTAGPSFDAAPRLPRRQRAWAAVVSVLISTIVLSSVVLGLTAPPEAHGPLAGQPAVVQPG